MKTFLQFNSPTRCSGYCHSMREEIPIDEVDQIFEWQGNVVVRLLNGRELVVQSDIRHGIFFKTREETIINKCP